MYELRLAGGANNPCTLRGRGLNPAVLPLRGCLQVSHHDFYLAFRSRYVGTGSSKDQPTDLAGNFAQPRFSTFLHVSDQILEHLQAPGATENVRRVMHKLVRDERTCFEPGAEDTMYWDGRRVAVGLGALPSPKLCVLVLGACSCSFRGIPEILRLNCVVCCHFMRIS